MADAAYLSQNDTIMWMVESDPLLRSTIAAVVLLDDAPDWQRVQRRVDAATRLVPALRAKVVPVPLHPTTLRWVEDPAFELSYHLRRMSLPAGSGVQDLLDWARTTAMSGFDSTRPLWEFTLVEGVGSAAAFVMKAHHVVTDGIGAVQLAAHLFDFEESPVAEPGDETPAHPHATMRPLSSLELLSDVVAHDLDGLARAVRLYDPKFSRCIE